MCYVVDVNFFRTWIEREKPFTGVRTDESSSIFFCHCASRICLNNTVSRCSSSFPKAAPLNPASINSCPDIVGSYSMNALISCCDGVFFMSANSIKSSSDNFEFVNAFLSLYAFSGVKPLNLKRKDTYAHSSAEYFNAFSLFETT